MNKFFSRRESFWIICKLFFLELFSDFWGIVFLLFFPVAVSLLWILLVEYDIVPEIPDSSRFSNPLSLWYDYTIFWLNSVSVVFFALRFSQFCKTILFRKIIVAQISFAKIIFATLFFFFLFSLFVFLLKFGLLMYYPAFRQQINNAQILGWIGGFLMLIFTSLSLGLLFGTFSIPNTSLTFLVLFVSLSLLVLGGFFLNIEFLLSFRDWNKGIQSWTEINERVRIYRIISFISPFQPSLQIITASHLNQDWNMPLRLFGSQVYYRPMTYSNYWTPFLVALTWIVGINLLNYLILLRKKY